MNPLRSGLVTVPLSIILATKLLESYISETDVIFLLIEISIPPRKGGWLELKDIFLPNRQDQYCCPEKKELLDLPSIKEAVLKAFESSDEDERLYENPRTVREPPYSHIIGRATSACLEGAIATTIRIYLIENMDI